MQKLDFRGSLLESMIFGDVSYECFFGQISGRRCFIVGSLFVLKAKKILIPEDFGVSMLFSSKGMYQLMVISCWFGLVVGDSNRGTPK